jgi:hypothetical protein
MGARYLNEDLIDLAMAFGWSRLVGCLAGALLVMMLGSGGSVGGKANG